MPLLKLYSDNCFHVFFLFRHRVQVNFAIPTGYLYHGYFTKEVPQLEVEDYILSSFDFDVRIGQVQILVSCCWSNFHHLHLYLKHLYLGNCTLSSVWLLRWSFALLLHSPFSNKPSISVRVDVDHFTRIGSYLYKNSIIYYIVVLMIQRKLRFFHI